MIHFLVASVSGFGTSCVTITVSRMARRMSRLGATVRPGHGPAAGPSLVAVKVRRRIPCGINGCSPVRESKTVRRSGQSAARVQAGGTHLSRHPIRRPTSRWRQRPREPQTSVRRGVRPLLEGRHADRALITGRTDFGHFGYDVCPSVSWDHPGHAARRANGNPAPPLFNVYGADLETIQFCCTSGHCEGCRDSQAVQTWLLVSVRHFLHSREALETWVELAENYWREFVWSPYHARCF